MPTLSPRSTASCAAAASYSGKRAATDSMRARRGDPARDVALRPLAAACGVPGSDIGYSETFLCISSPTGRRGVRSPFEA